MARHRPPRQIETREFAREGIEGLGIHRKLATEGTESTEMQDLEREIAGKFFEGYSVEDLVDEYPFPTEEVESIIRDNSQIKEPKE
jgi:hypothetical protein